MDMPALTPWQKFADVDLKKAYAGLIYVRPDNDRARYEAACLVFPDQADTAIAARVALEWHYDPIVLKELDRLRAEEPIEKLPSLEELAREVYNLGRDTTKSVTDRVKAYQLYADLRGMVQRPSIINNNNNNTGHTYVDKRKVMVLPPVETQEEWEAKTIEQQRRLVADASRT